MGLRFPRAPKGLSMASGGEPGRPTLVGLPAATTCSHVLWVNAAWLDAAGRGGKRLFFLPCITGCIRTLKAGAEGC